MIFSNTHYRSAVLDFIDGWPLFTMDVSRTPGASKVYHDDRETLMMSLAEAHAASVAPPPPPGGILPNG
jgi:hypothetical protein